MKILRNHLGLVITAAVILALLVIGFIPRPVIVETVEAMRAPMAVTIEEEGRTRVIDHYVLSAPVDGYARRITLDVGDTVERGQVIGALEPLRPAVLDPRSRAEAEARVAAATAALNAAEREVNAAEADAKYAGDELERLKRLYDTGVIPLDQLQQAQTAARRTQARLESARFAVDVSRFDKSAAEAALNYSAAPDENVGDAGSIPIRAPVGGQVLRIHHKSEGVVARGQPLVDIGDPDSLEVVVEVLSRDAVRIVREMKVLLTRWGGDEALQGRVKTVEPVGFTKVSALGVEEQRVQVIVEIVTPRAQWARLGDGYRVEAAFLLWEADNALQVPTSALFRVDQDWALFLAEDGRAVLQVVKPGQRSGISTQILAGIEAGQELVNHPGDNLEPGSPIRPR